MTHQIQTRFRATCSVSALTMALASAWPGLAHAQSPRADIDTSVEVPGAPVRVVPPKALNVAVAYPVDAEGDASVVLRFVVTIQGKVIEAEVIGGDEPFASAAAAASRGWKFEPASRGGEPVAVRIAMEVRYVQEVATEPPPELTQPGSALPATPERSSEAGALPALTPKSPGSGQVEVEPIAEVVIADERQPGSNSLSRGEARQIPGALFGDPLRALDVLPGINTMISGLPMFYLRGAPPGNIGFYIDEIKVPMLYHAFLGPSVISSELIERVNIHSTSSPGRYGRLAGGVIEAELQQPDHETTYTGGLGLWETNLSAAAPFDGDRGSFFVGGRYALTGLLVSALSPTAIEYWNYQALGYYDVTPKDTLRVFAFGALDFFQRGDAEFLGVDFHRVDARLNHDFSEKTSAYAGVTLGADRTYFELANITDRSLNGRVRLSHQINPRLELRTGASVKFDEYTLDLSPDVDGNSEDLKVLFPARDDTGVGAFIELPWQATPGVRIVPAVRADLYSSGGRELVGIDPRLSARIRLTPDVEAVHAVAYSHQGPNFVPNVPGLSVAGLEGGLQSTLHSSSGIDAQLPADIRMQVNLFQNVFFDLTDPFSLSQKLSLDALNGRKRAMGHSYGAEFEFRRHLTRRLGAFASYTLSRSTRSFDSIETVAGSDRTHILNLAAMYTMGANIRLGARSLMYSGVPGKERGQPRFPYARTRPFARLDLRVERRFRLGPRSWWSVIVEALNATQSREQVASRCSRNAEGELSCKNEVLPAIFLPNVKLEGKF